MIETVVRFVKAWEAEVAFGSVRRVGRVRVERVYESPYLFISLAIVPFGKQEIELWGIEVSGGDSRHGRIEGLFTVSKPREMLPTNFSVLTVLLAIFANEGIPSKI